MASLVPELWLVTCILLCLPQGQKLGTANSLALWHCSTGDSGGSWGVGTQLRDSWSFILLKLPAALVQLAKESQLGLTLLTSLPRDCSGSHLLFLGRCFPQPAWRKEVAVNARLPVSKADSVCALLCCFPTWVTFIANCGLAAWGDHRMQLHADSTSAQQFMPLLPKALALCTLYTYVHRVHKAVAGTLSFAS